MIVSVLIMPEYLPPNFDLNKSKCMLNKERPTDVTCFIFC